MKKLLALTLGFVTLALIGTEVMVKTQAVILNTGYSQWSQPALLTNFPNRQPTTAESALALSNFDYDFETLVNNQTIFGQDKWVNAVVGTVAVRKGLGANQTQTAKGEGGNAGSGARRPLDQAFYYTSNDTKVAWGVWGYVPSGGNNVTAIGGLLPCFFGPHQLGGITKLTTFLQRQAPLPYVTGDVLLHDHWYEYRVTVDFSVSGGLATLSYRDVTSGATVFTYDSAIKNVPLGLVPDSSGRYGFSEVYVRNDGAGYVDNLHFDAPAPLPACTPRPSGLISWWPGDGSANDIQGSNNGTLINGVTFAVGKVGPTFSLDGADDYVKLSNSPYNPFPATGFTYDFWISPFDTPPGRSRTIISNHHATGNWWNGISLFNGTVEFVLQNAATGQTFRWQTSSTLNPNTWQLVAVTYRNSGNLATDAVIYFNGTPQALNTHAIGPAYSIGFTPGYSATDPLGFALGRLLEDTPSAYFRGLIDEGEFFNRALTQQEIKGIFSSGSAGKCKGKKDKGMTWFHTASNATYGTITVGCGPAGPNRCDPAHGDTLCTQQLPVLCIYKPTPAFSLPKGLWFDQYNRWSGGVVATTQPVAGDTFKDSAAVTAYCKATFGDGWRVAEFHDGLYWNFQAYGGTVSAPTVPSTRFWAHQRSKGWELLAAVNDESSSVLITLNPRDGLQMKLFA